MPLKSVNYSSIFIITVPYFTVYVGHRGNETHTRRIMLLYCVQRLEKDPRTYGLDLASPHTPFTCPRAKNQRSSDMETGLVRNTIGIRQPFVLRFGFISVALYIYNI